MNSAPSVPHSTVSLRPVMRQGAPSDDGAEHHLQHFYVYILLQSNSQLYTGFTANLDQRIKAHKQGRVKSTEHRRPLELIHVERYRCESDARRRERFLKTTEGKRLLRQQIRDVLRDNGVIE